MEFLKKIFGIKSETLSIEKLIKLLNDDKCYLHNGYTVSWSGSGVTDKELHDAKGIKLGLGEVTSGYGDWGGGFSHARTYAVRIPLDKDFNIIGEVKFDDFYNSPKWSKKKRKIAEEYFAKNNFKNVSIKENSNLYKRLKEAFVEYGGKNDSITHSEFKYEI